MTASLKLQMLPQPDDTTCGPTCLHAVYNYHGHHVSLPQLVQEIPALNQGGTLAVFLACHALEHGFQATIYTYNLQMFDPSWFRGHRVNLCEKLTAQSQRKSDPRLQAATRGYLEFLRLGGKVRFESLTTSLIRRYLTRGMPILTGLSATYLYQSVREVGASDQEDDVAGEPTGHFVVLCGYDRKGRQVSVADPMHPNPLADTHIYSVRIDRVLGAVLLGILTYDANLLIIEPQPKHGRREGT